MRRIARNFFYQATGLTNPVRHPLFNDQHSLNSRLSSSIRLFTQMTPAEKMERLQRLSFSDDTHNVVYRKT